MQEGRCGICSGEYEAAVLKKEFPDKIIRCVPAYIYEHN